MSEVNGVRCPHCRAVLDVRLHLKLAIPGEVLEEHVAATALSTRAYSAVRNLNVETVGQLMQRTERDLIRLKNCGKKTIAEIKALLAERGLSLREPDREES
jgi:DNA-directed RNA polymerase subunit alpha